MCVICRLWEKELITTSEAKKATWELVMTGDPDMVHLQELYGKLDEQEKDERGYEQVD